MQATQLAAEGVEQLRAGQSLRPLGCGYFFERTGRVGLWNDHPGLYRVDVTVSWNDGTPHTFLLSTLVRR